jgi:hypothetical protein
MTRAANHGKRAVLTALFVCSAAGPAGAGLDGDAVIADHPRGSLTVKELEMKGAMEHAPATKDTLRGWILRSGAVDYTLPAAEQAGLEASPEFLLGAGRFKVKRLADAFYQREVREAARPSREEVLASITIREDMPFVYQIITETAEDAERARARLLAGETIDAVGREVSVGLNATTGSSTGYLIRGSGHYTPEEEALLGSMKTGEISAVVPGPLGFSVFQVGKILSADEQKERCFGRTEAELYGQRLRQRAKEVPARLRAAAKIVVHEDVLADPPLIGVAKYPPVVAEGDGQPIFYQQEFSTPRRSPKPWTADDRTRVLESAIDEVLFAREAERLGYAREPEFVERYEPSRRNGLWRAWLANLEENPPVSGEEIVAAYLAEKPKLPKGKQRKKITVADIPAAERERIAGELRKVKRLTVVQDYIKDAEAKVVIRPAAFEAAWEAYRSK